MSTAPPTGTSPAAGSATGQFYVSNGQFIDPTGNLFVARGFNIGPEQMADVSANIDRLFPGTNFIRFATGFVDDPHSISDYVSFVSQMAAKGIVVEFEDHPWPLEAPKTGADLQAELSRYSELAAALKDQPYAWFGSMNEPQSDYGAAEAAISTQDKAIYDAIRGTGNNNIILMEGGVGAGNPGSVGAGFGMDPNAFKDMHNVGWDHHFYGWVSGRSTDQSVVDNYLNGSANDGYGVAAAQTITSADGIMPVIIGEFGDSTDGVSIDANAEQVVHAVTSSPYGYAAWHWGSYSGGGDSLTNGNSLTHLGQEIADSIAARAAGGPTPTPTPTPASGNEITATSGGSLTDAAGNVWTLPGGAVTENGNPVPGGGGTAAFAIVDGKLYGQDAGTGSWYTYSTQSQAWTSSAAPSLTPTPTPGPTPTPDPTPAGNPGQWLIASVNGMQYMVLLPDGYNPGVKYPTTLYLHQLDNGSFGPEPLQQQIDPWFNTASFRSAHPSIVVAPLLEQNADMSGQTINFGGVSTQDTAGETNAVAALKQVMGQYSVDPSRVYVTGNSMGGIGTWDMLVKYNVYTGTEGKIFAAGLPLAGADYGQDPAQSAALLKNVPIWAIHGEGDGQVPLSWDQTLYAAEQASSGLMKYTQDPNLGHDVWDTYYPQTGSGSPLGWLYNQQVAVGTPTPVPTPTPNPTPDPTPAGEITATSGGSLTDASGNVWTLPNGVVTENGQPVPDGGGTQAFAIVNSKYYGEDAKTGSWYTYSTQTQSWAPSAAPSTPTPTPTPPPQEITAVSGGSLTDAAGNVWTLPGSNVTENGKAVPDGGGTQAFAIVNSKYYGEDAKTGSWYTYSTQSQSWTPSTAPLFPTSSPNYTTMLPGSSAAVAVPVPKPDAVTLSIPSTQASTTVSQSNISVLATAGDHMVFVTGSGDTLNLSGGKETITDTGKNNTYAIPAAGKGFLAFTSNILSGTDTLDLRPALAGTQWNGSAASIGSFLHVTDTPAGATLSVSATANGGMVGVTSFANASTATLQTMLAHAIN